MGAVLQIIIADTFFKRFVGLLGRCSLRTNEALLLSKCPRVHTFFMGIAIDVVVLDGSDRVLRIIECLTPWRIAPRVTGAVSCLEMAAGAARAFGIVSGLRLQCEQVGDGQLLGRMV